VAPAVPFRPVSLTAIIARSALAGLVALVLASPAGAGAAVRVSGDGVPQCSGPAQVRGYEVEPSLAASGSLLVGAWQQDRTDASGRGAIANMVAVSTDGGRTWSRQLVEGVSECGGGPYQNASDPWAEIGPDGRIYVSSLGNTKAGPQRTIWVQGSSDGGATWDRALVDGPNTANDKETLTADPYVPGRAWVAWFGEGPEGVTQVTSRTDDGGRTWTQPAPVHPGGPSTDIHILPLAPNRLLAVYSTSPGAFSSNVTIESALSNDGGLTWREAPEVYDFTSNSPFDEAADLPIRADARVFSATSTTDGIAYVAVQELFGEQSRISVFRSADGGASWQRRRAAHGRGQRIVPTVAASEDGSVAVSYIAMKGKGKKDTRYRIATSDDRGENWSDQAMTKPFNPRKATSAGDIFLGDYTGLASLGPGQGYGALVTVAKPLAENGPTDVFFHRVP
jgi:hypothetical protein